MWVLLPLSVMVAAPSAQALSSSLVSLAMVSFNMLIASSLDCSLDNLDSEK